MANILITNDAIYKPMSLEKMLKPYELMTEEYRLLEKGIADLETEAEDLRSIAEKDLKWTNNKDGTKTLNRKDSKSYALKYWDYAEELDKKADELTSKGLKGVNRKSLYDLQAQYKTTVEPIEKASKIKTLKSDEQRKALLANPDLRFDVDFSTINLQQLIDNPDLGYNIYNLDDYDKLGIDIASGIYNTLSERITENTESGGQWYDVRRGISGEDVINYKNKEYGAISLENKAALDELYTRADKLTEQLPSNIKEEAKTRLINTAINNLKETTTYRANSKHMSDLQRQTMALDLLNLGYKLEGNSVVEDPTSLAYQLKKLKEQGEAAKYGLKKVGDEWVKDPLNPVHNKYINKYSTQVAPGIFYNKYTKKYHDALGTTISDYSKESLEKTIKDLHSFKPIYFYDEGDKDNIKLLEKEGRFEEHTGGKWAAQDITYYKAPSTLQEQINTIVEKSGIPIEAIRIEKDRDTGVLYGNEYKISIKPEYIKEIQTELDRYNEVLTDSENLHVKVGTLVYTMKNEDKRKIQTELFEKTNMTEQEKINILSKYISGVDSSNVDAIINIIKEEVTDITNSNEGL